MCIVCSWQISETAKTACVGEHHNARYAPSVHTHKAEKEGLAQWEGGVEGRTPSNLMWWKGGDRGLMMQKTHVTCLSFKRERKAEWLFNFFKDLPRENIFTAKIVYLLFCLHYFYDTHYIEFKCSLYQTNICWKTNSSRDDCFGALFLASYAFGLNWSQEPMSVFNLCIINLGFLLLWYCFLCCFLHWSSSVPQYSVKTLSGKS